MDPKADGLLPTAKIPFLEDARRRVQDQRVGFQRVNGLRRPAPLQVAGAGVQMTGVTPERITDQVTGLRERAAYREVQLALGRVEGLIGKDHVDVHVRVTLGVLRDQLRQNTVAEELGGGKTHPAARHAAETGQVFIRLTLHIQHFAGMGQQAFTRLGQAYGAGGAIKQLGPGTILQALNGAGHRTGGAPQRACRRDEAALARYGHEGFERPQLIQSH